MPAFDFDKSNIHLVFEKSRLLPDETIRLWMEAIRNGISGTPLSTIVDLGCGSGRFSKALSDFFEADVYGIDPSEKMLSVAMENVELPRIKFLKGFAEHIPLANDFADLVFVSHVYHHIQKKEKAVREMKRVLIADGYLCIRQTPLEELDGFIYPDFFPSAKKIDAQRLPAKEEILKAVEKEGFELIKYTVIRQLFADNKIEYYEKIRPRGTSDLTAISDSEFFEGLKRLKKYCYNNEPEKPVYENVGLFIFRIV